MLTKRQQIFVNAYKGNGVQAAIAAGYSARSAGVQAARLLKNANVMSAIQERAAKEDAELIADRRERLKFLTAMMRNRDEPSPVRLKAADLMCKASGDYLNRTEISGPDGRPIQISADGAAEDADAERNYDNLTDAEQELLLALVSKLEGDFEPVESLKRYYTWLADMPTYTPEEAAHNTEEAQRRRAEWEKELARRRAHQKGVEARKRWEYQ